MFKEGKMRDVPSKSQMPIEQMKMIHRALVILVTVLVTAMLVHAIVILSGSQEENLSRHKRDVSTTPCCNQCSVNAEDRSGDNGRSIALFGDVDEMLNFLEEYITDMELFAGTYDNNWAYSGIKVNWSRNDGLRYEWGEWKRVWG